MPQQPQHQPLPSQSLLEQVRTTTHNCSVNAAAVAQDAAQYSACVVKRCLIVNLLTLPICTYAIAITTGTSAPTTAKPAAAGDGEHNNTLLRACRLVTGFHVHDNALLQTRSTVLVVHIARTVELIALRFCLYCNSTICICSKHPLPNCNCSTNHCQASDCWYNSCSHNSSTNHCSAMDISTNHR
jgi:hypothetical protein